MSMDEHEVRQRPMLSHQLSRIESSNLRDLLQVRDDESGSSRTLATVLSHENRELAGSASGGTLNRAMSNRTLLDVIKDEDDPRRLIPGNGHRPSWKAFKDRLRLRRTTAVWSASSSGGDVVAAPGSPRPVSILEGTSTLLLPNMPSITQTTLNTQEGDSERDVPTDAPPEQLEGPMRVSLMALLEHEERTGPSFAASVMGLVEEEEEEEEERSECGGEKKEMSVCCVCMVRHKGAAFIPCGHTFCRLCSRELWVSRGNCPLCNGFILEILDIF